MAHAARLDDGIVTDVIVVPDDLDATESDAAIEAFIHSIGLTGSWIRTSYNAADNGFRGTYAGIGYTYDADLDEFVAPLIEETDEELVLEHVEVETPTTP